MIKWLKCLIGIHDLKPTVNAKYDMCVHCGIKVRVV